MPNYSLPDRPDAKLSDDSLDKVAGGDGPTVVANPNLNLNITGPSSSGGSSINTGAATVSNLGVSAPGSVDQSLVQLNAATSVPSGLKYVPKMHHT